MDNEAEGEIERLEARVAKLEDAIRGVIRYEWGDPSSGEGAVPDRGQRPWRVLADLVDWPRRGGA